MVLIEMVPHEVACAKIMILVNQNQGIRRPGRQQTIRYKMEVVIWD